jgi:hypothetical protein
MFVETLCYCILDQNQYPEIVEAILVVCRKLKELDVAATLIDVPEKAERRGEALSTPCQWQSFVRELLAHSLTRKQTMPPPPPLRVNALKQLLPRSAVQLEPSLM